MSSTNADTSPPPPSLIQFTSQTLRDEDIRQWVATAHPHLYILTPCYGGMCHLNYMICLLKTWELFRSLNISLKTEFCKGDSLVPRARNNLIAKAMNEPTMTHVLFIDADMAWEPMDIVKLLMSEKEVVGGVYPLKAYHWGRLMPSTDTPNPIQSMVDRKRGSLLHDAMTDEQMMRFNLVKYNINYLGPHLVIDNNYAQVRHLATGFMMLRRGALETMMAGYPATKYTDDINFLSPEENRFAYALFDCGVEEGHYFSEDWLFCHRWSQLGGAIWVNVAINLTHTGVEDYAGSLLASLQGQAAR